MKTLLPTLLILISLTFTSRAQLTIEYLDVNNVKAAILTHGDMFWNPSTGSASYQFPQGSGLNSNFASSLWVGGYDTSGNLHISAQTYRQSGNDYWPGPLDNSGSLSLATSNDWDKIWKVDKSTIDAFNATTPHTLVNTPAVILEWPAIGNVHAKGKGGAALSITKDMAPFSDVNSDGIYNALDGDYPIIKGEQALWWVFSDNGPTHDETDGLPLKIEIQAMAFACNSVQSLQNTTFYSFSIKNFGNQDYINTTLGIWNDMDLGYGFDDYVGVDTLRRMAIGYNGDNDDNGKYGSQLTQTGCIILRSPLDSAGYQQPLGSFMSYENAQNAPAGNPDTTIHYLYYLTAKWLDSSILTTACHPPGPGALTHFMFYSDPSDPLGWSEKTCNNIPGDRRSVLGISPNTMHSLQEMKLEFAIINTPLGSNNGNFQALQALADSAKYYSNGCAQPSMPTSVNELITENQFSIHPNPSSENITISWNESMKDKVVSVTLINTMGETLQTSFSPKEDARFNVQSLPDGVYFVKINTGHRSVTKRFVKN